MSEGPEDRVIMQRCLDLARKGLGKTAPNPLVGCVIMAGGKIIGEGHHGEFGGPHAEVVAIASVKKPELLAESTLFVNLEPCSHHGKTPPCSALIVQKSIPEVVIGSKDPNALVEGKGIQHLSDNGVRVRSGIMERECRELNRRFFTFHKKKRPYIILKWAQTDDGFMDRPRSAGEPSGINWISDEYARQWVHKWRSEEQAILVGTNTAANDDPDLTVREWHGTNPLRLVLDMKGRLPAGLKLFKGKTQTLVFTRNKQENRKNVDYVEIPEGADPIDKMLDHLYTMDIQSLIVEGGAMLLESFLFRDLWDEARVFSADSVFGEGLKAPVIRQDMEREIPFYSGILRIYRQKK